VVNNSNNLHKRNNNKIEVYYVLKLYLLIIVQ
jgi:hypothetical protein